MAWSTSAPVKKIGTPSGEYTPQSDNIETEVTNAARFAGLGDFRVFVNGNEIESPDDLQTDSLAALNADVRVEAYDKAS
jgi:hypothetical protein